MATIPDPATAPARAAIVPYREALRRIYEADGKRCPLCRAVKMGTPYNEVKHKLDCIMPSVLSTPEVP
jgi:hypothetical protein